MPTNRLKIFLGLTLSVSLGLSAAAFMNLEKLGDLQNAEVSRLCLVIGLTIFGLQALLGITVSLCWKETGHRLPRTQEASLDHSTPRRSPDPRDSKDAATFGLEAVSPGSLSPGPMIKNHSYLDEVINTMTGALLIVEPDRTIRAINQASRDLLGYEESELQGQPLDVICPETEPVNTGSLIRLSTDGRVRNLERLFLHKDGRSIPVLFSGSSLRDAQGQLREFVCVAYDISASKGLEEKLRASLHEKELLLREVHHRVKNNLQVISSLLDLQSDQIDDPQFLELIQDSRHRIRSMALIHEQLYRTRDLSELQVGSYLENIVAHLFRSFGVEPGRIVLRLKIEDVDLDLDRAIACGLIVNELVSNCLEHAFDAEGGHIRLELFRAGEKLHLAVQDNGRGFDPEASDGEETGKASSMGLELVHMMTRQLQGTLEITRSQGMRLALTFPAAPGDVSLREPRA